MGLPPTVVDRALTLCRNGEVRSWESLRDRLAREGFDAEHPALSRHQDRFLDAMRRAQGNRELSGSLTPPWSRPKTGTVSPEAPNGP